MLSLANTYWKDVYALYKTQVNFFPIIACVLLEKQKGRVLVDKFPYFSQVYVEHHFGFAQIFGCQNIEFEAQLRDYFFIQKKFSVNKIRLYATFDQGFLGAYYQNSSCSNRQRSLFSFEDNLPRFETTCDISLLKVGMENIDIVDRYFGLSSRFWSNGVNFAYNSRAIILLYKGAPASICYAAAEANRLVELDILTLEQFRNLGLGKAVAEAFIQQCKDEKLNISWDCFVNNLSSMNLAESLGFKIIQKSYPFYTINP